MPIKYVGKAEEEYIEPASEVDCKSAQDVEIVDEAEEDVYLYSDEEEEEAYRICKTCCYEWKTQGYFVSGKGRVAFSWSANGCGKNEVRCSMCVTGVEEYYPSPSDDEC